MFPHSRTFSSDMPPGLPGFKTLLETINSGDPLYWPPALDGGHCLSGGTCHEMGDVFYNDMTHLDSFHDVWGLSRRDEERYTSVNSTLELEMKRKICDACNKMDISSDPSKWTIDDVHRWLRWTMKQMNSSPSTISPHDWFVTGSQLCTMTLPEFEARLPQEGEILYAQLEMWKTAHATGLSQCDTQFSIVSDHVTDSPDSIPSYAVLESMEALRNLPPLLSIHDEQFSPSSSMSVSPPERDRFHAYSDSLVTHTDGRGWEQSPFLGHAPTYVKLEACLSSSCNDDNTSLDSWMHSPVTSSTAAMCREAGEQKNYNRKWMLDSHNMADNMASVTSTRRKRTICLWQFLKELLLMPNPYQSWIRWLDRNNGVFKIEDSVRVAKLWGERKNRPAMNYDKLSRSIRQYYKKGIIQKTTQSKRLVYQFCPAYLN